MLQHVLVKRIERLYRLRFIYGLHLTLYGFALALSAFTVSTTFHWQLLVVWFTLLLAHTAAHSLYEKRERCLVYAPVPTQIFKHTMLPVDLYDEQGNRIPNERENGALPSPREW